MFYAARRTSHILACLLFSLLALALEASLHILASVERDLEVDILQRDGDTAPMCGRGHHNEGRRGRLAFIYKV